MSADLAFVHDDHGAGALDLGVLLLLPLLGATLAYLVAARGENRRGRRSWPPHRSVLFVTASAIVAACLVGPLATAAHSDFTAHMAVHLLVGMLAPLLFVLSAPMTLALRTLPIVPGRRLSRLARTLPVTAVSHPITGAVLSVGSLWLVYGTPASAAMLRSSVLHHLLLVHFLAAGLLFTASLISIDPAPHRASFRLRLGVLLLAVAAHSILAKQIYIAAPSGTDAEQARAGALLMYYGGDLIELLLITVFLAQWYVHARPKQPPARRVIVAE